MCSRGYVIYVEKAETCAALGECLGGFGPDFWIFESRFLGDGYQGPAFRMA